MPELWDYNKYNLNAESYLTVTSPASSAPLPLSLSLLSLSLSDHRRVSGARAGGGRKARVESGYFSLEKIKPESRPPPPQQLQITSPTRYSYPDTDALTPCRSPEYCDPFLSSHSPSPFSSSQSSLDSEASSSTQTSGASWEARCHPALSMREYASLADIPKAKRISNRGAFQVEKKRLEQRTRARSPGREEVARIFGTERRYTCSLHMETPRTFNIKKQKRQQRQRVPTDLVGMEKAGRSQVIDQFETLDSEHAERMETSSSSEPCSFSSSTCRQGRSERRSYPKKQEFTLEASKEGFVPDVSAPPISPYRRAKSLDRRATESSMTPDLLNFKKGWMTKLYEDNQWKKHWFVLTDQSLRYYRDSIAEEAADLDGEIDLSTCHDVTEFPVQRNYGFQIHTKEGVFTLSAMTSGIRRNWIQAIMKNARPATAPDVTSSLPEDAKVHSTYESASASGEIQESEVDGGSTEQRRSRARERRREGRSKTFDWAEFRPMQQAMAQKASSPSTSDSAQISEAASQDPSNMTDLERERAQRREERRKRFESVTTAEEATRMEVDRAPASPETKPVQVEIEQRWHKVETMPLREEKQIPITTLHSTVPVAEPLPPQELAALLDKELGQTQRELSRLKQENHLLQEQLEGARGREHSAREGYVLQVTPEHSARENYVLQVTPEHSARENYVLQVTPEHSARENYVLQVTPEHSARENYVLQVTPEHSARENYVLQVTPEHSARENYVLQVTPEHSARENYVLQVTPEHSARENYVLQVTPEHSARENYVLQVTPEHSARENYVLQVTPEHSARENYVLQVTPEHSARENYVLQVTPEHSARENYVLQVTPEHSARENYVLQVTPEHSARENYVLQVTPEHSARENYVLQVTPEHSARENYVLQVTPEHSARENYVLQVTPEHSARENYVLQVTPEHSARENYVLQVTPEHSARENYVLQVTPEHSARENYVLQVTPEHSARENYVLQVTPEHSARENYVLQVTPEHSARENYVLQVTPEHSARENYVLQVTPEHSARENYVLQTDTAASPMGSWQRLHKLNQDLQTKIESQRQLQDLTNQQVQALKQNYGEAKDVIRNHEVEIQNLQTKLNNTMAGIQISEQAIAKMRSDLKMEQEKFREGLEDWEHNEQTLRSQLRDSEDRLKDVETLLLEKSQALRDLERQQALQRDYQKEVQKLQDRLTEVTSQLVTTEQAQGLKEERVQKNYEMLRESHEKEKESLALSLVEAERKVREFEDRLQEAEQQVDNLQMEKRTTTLESSEVVHHLEEELVIKNVTIQKLTENIRDLEEEKNQLTCRCQELISQITEADNEVAKLQSRLKTEETDYYNLEHSYEKVSEELQKIHKVISEKDEEIKQAKEMYERLMEKKDRDLNEALIKMAALGSSLEETECKLQLKEELISKIGHSGSEAGSTVQKEGLQCKLEAAEVRITELQQLLDDLQLGYSELQLENGKLQEDCDDHENIRKQESSTALDQPQTTNIRPKVRITTDTGAVLSKRQRIRFSSIHYQKCGQDDTEKLWASNTSSDTSQDRSLSEESGSSDPPQHYLPSANTDPERFISIIHSLETKLYITEEKLKDVTLKLEEQQSRQLEVMMEHHSKWAKTEMELREQLGESVSKVDTLTAQLQLEMDKRHAFAQENICHIRAVRVTCEKALVCLESGREKVQSILTCHEENSTDQQLHTLSEIEVELVNAAIHIGQGRNTLEEQAQKCQEAPKESRENELSDEEKIKLFAKTLAFEALVLNKMANSIQNPNLDLLQSLSEVHKEAEKLKSSDESYVAIAYTDVLTQKLMLESEFWSEVEKLQTQFKETDNSGQESKPGGPGLLEQAGKTVITNTCIKAELTFAVQNLKEFYEQKIQKVEGDLLKARRDLQKREFTLKEIVKAYKSPELDRVILEVGDEFKKERGRKPELAPYVEQIEMEEAHNLAVLMVDQHLQYETPPCRLAAVEPSSRGRDKLADELKQQAEVLQRLSQDMESTCHSQTVEVHHRLHKVSHMYTSEINTSPSLLMRDALIQAQVAYVACRIKADHEKDLKQCKDAYRNMDTLCQEHAKNVNSIRERYEKALQEERHTFAQAAAILKDENQALKAEAAHHLSELSLQQSRILQDIESMEERHEDQVQKLEDRFHGKIQELQRIHEKEMLRLHGHYTQTIKALQLTLDKYKCEHLEASPSESCKHHKEPRPEDSTARTQTQGEKTELDSVTVLRERIQELEAQMNVMRDELEHKHLEGDVSSLKEKYQKDFENFKATCERGFAAMEETHQKVLEDIQRQHQREVGKLREEKDRLLAEETAATIAAIEAMKNAHREELERTQRAQISGMSSDIEELRRQYQ
ncbi:UNVERIFIED_CONTAM: hypothetical protein FKN15_062416 [Acipenser sinensis]